MKPIKKATYSHEAIHSIKSKLRNYKLHTVCEEARCPNLGECFSRGTATFMILGGTCTRSCKFCNVGHLEPETRNLERWNTGTLEHPCDSEPESIARMVLELGLSHVVVTSVTRDDLPDEGAAHFAKTISLIRQSWGRFSRQSLSSATPLEKSGIFPSQAAPRNGLREKRPQIEVLTPDFHAREDCLRTICEAAPDIYNHNIETVRRLTPVIRSHANYDRSLQVLSWVKKHYPNIVTKSGLMVGLGEEREEVLETLGHLCKAGCRVVTIGQYLAPSKGHFKVAEYLPNEAFEEYKVLGERMGIKHVFSGHFVRSSYMAEWSSTL